MDLREKQFKTAFLSIAGVGRATLGRVQKVLAKYQISEDDFWSKPDQILLVEARVTPKQQQGFADFRQQYQPQDYWQFLQQHHIKVVFDSDDNYPDLLKQTHDRPLLLFVKGKLPAAINLPIAVVGTRHFTSYGQMVTEKIVKELASFKTTIISGLMYGIDSLAHQVALDAGASTIGVLGYGFDHCYPVSHQPFLTEFLKRGGICISELAPHIEADPYNFPARNRIVAGMSWAVLVTEAGLKSGSHITAGKAGDYGRDLFAVPGPINNPYCEGTKKLINDGAILVSSGEDIINSLTIKSQAPVIEEKLKQTVKEDQKSKNQAKFTLKLNNILEQKIYDLLLTEGKTADDLALYLDVPIADITAALSILEIQGIINQLGDVWLVK